MSSFGDWRQAVLELTYLPLVILVGAADGGVAKSLSSSNLAGDSVFISVEMVPKVESRGGCV